MQRQKSFNGECQNVVKTLIKTVIINYLKKNKQTNRKKQKLNKQTKTNTNKITHSRETSKKLNKVAKF